MQNGGYGQYELNGQNSINNDNNFNQNCERHLILNDNSCINERINNNVNNININNKNDQSQVIINKENKEIKEIKEIKEHKEHRANKENKDNNDNKCHSEHDKLQEYSEDLKHINKLADITNKNFNVPFCANWFNLNQVHDIEKNALPEFFSSNTQYKTSDLYKELRNSIIKVYKKNPRNYLSFIGKYFK